MIPSGKVSTYGDVARKAGLPGAARRVGRALRGLPPDTRIPWHRVINARGEISKRSEPGYEFIQQDMLQAEGVVFDRTGKIDMKRFRWIPRDADQS